MHSWGSKCGSQSPSCGAKGVTERQRGLMGIPFMADSIGKLHQPTGPSSSCLRKSYRLPVTMCLFLGGGGGGAEIMATVANHWSPRSLWQWLAWWLANEMKKNVCLEGFWEWFSPNQKQKLWGNSFSSLESAVSSMWCCFFLWEEGQTDQERNKDSRSLPPTPKST